MATATSQIALGSRNAFDTIAASQTDSVLVAARTGFRIRVTAFAISCGGTASTVQFGSKLAAGATTAVSPVYQNSISQPEVKKGWFQTISGEGLVVSTGAGSNSGVIVIWEYAKA